MPDSDEANERVYLASRTEEDGEKSYKIDTDLSSLCSWGRGEPEADESDSATDASQYVGSDIPSPFLELLRKISEKARQQNEMISFINALGRDMPAMMLDKGAVGDAGKHRQEVDKTEKHSVVALEYEDLPAITENLKKVSTLADGLSQLPDAILLSLVGTFDSQMSDIVGTMLEVRPEKFKLGEKTMSLARILKAEKIEDIVEEAITDEVYQFSRESHDSQVKYIEENFSVDIKKDWKRWPDFIEVFERRNLVAHGEVYFTKRYVENCKSHGHKGSETLLGNNILVTTQYIRQCLSILTECAILTTFSLWRKHFKSDEEHAFNYIVYISFEIIKSRQYQLATYICDYALGLKTTARKENVRLRLVVNLASAHAHMKQNEAAENILDKEDWSATSDDFQICVASIRKKVDEVVRLMPIIKAANKISMDDFRDWPVFDFVKKEVAFKEKFEELFGEKYRIIHAVRPLHAVQVLEHGEDSQKPTESSLFH